MRVHTLDLGFQGSQESVAAYLVEALEGPILVDCGPMTTLDRLLAELAALGYGPEDVRHVLLTHIHLDHAGAAQWFADRNARIYVHPFGAPHLVDPSRLIRSAGMIYGDEMDRLWGEVLPAPAGRVIPTADEQVLELNGLRIKVIATPGHARHHNCYSVADAAFVGDVAGDRSPGSELIAVPTPPPDFDVIAWQCSLERLAHEDLAVLYPVHYGPVWDVEAHLDRVRKLVRETAEFVRVRMEMGFERDQILRQFSEWQEQRAQEAGASPGDIEQHRLTDPDEMSVDGLIHYWRRRWESELPGEPRRAPVTS